jgi:hypothetical protein
MTATALATTDRALTTTDVIMVWIQPNRTEESTFSQSRLVSRMNNEEKEKPKRNWGQNQPGYLLAPQGRQVIVILNCLRHQKKT